jgi:Ser/Thr protein kinase RdoA (MazF antagonist)
VVLHDGSNLLLHLRPAPVVARVAAVVADVRRGPAWQLREVQVAGRLASAGAPVVPPAAVVAPGPHIRRHRVITFMAYVEVSAARPDPAAAGRALAACHAALARERLDLPPHALLQEARGLLPRLAGEGLLSTDDAEVIERAAGRAAAGLSASRLPLRAVHGDAHLGNALPTADGVLWNDWEDAFLGPVEWDLACLVHPARVLGEDRADVAAAMDAYTGPVDPRGLEAALVGRAVQGAVWSALFARERPGGPSEMVAAHVAWLREWAL